jgi:hypothetical protein
MDAAALRHVFRCTLWKPRRRQARYSAQVSARKQKLLNGSERDILETNFVKIVEVKGA